MKSLAILCAAGLMTAGAAQAQVQGDDMIKRDGDPVRVGDAQNPRMGAEDRAATDSQRAADRMPSRMYGSRDTEVAVVRIAEPDRGGTASDGDLWTSSVAASTGNATASIAVVSNTPIPDSMEHRRMFGGPLSRAGKMTQPEPGPVDD